MALKKKYNPLVKLGFDLYNEVEMPDLTNYFYNRYSIGDQLPIIVEHDLGGIEIQDINGDSFLYVGDNGSLKIGGTSTLIKSGHKRSVYDFYTNEINLNGSEATFKQNGILYLKSNLYADGIGTLEMPNVFLLNTGLENAEAFNVLTYKQANGNPLIQSSTHPVSGGYLAYYGMNGAPLIVSDNESVNFLMSGDDEPFLKREGYTTTITDGGEGCIKLIAGVLKSSIFEINAGDECFFKTAMGFSVKTNVLNLKNPSNCNFLRGVGNIVYLGDQTTPNVDAIYLSAAGIAHLKAQLGLA